MQPLASSDGSKLNTNTKLSTSISLSLVDENGTNIPFNVSNDEPIEFLIPRDPMGSFVEWEYVSIQNSTNRSFNLHSVDIPRNNRLDVSVHFEIRPVNTDIAYWFIYKFDGAPQLNSLINSIDGKALLCPPSTSFLFVYDSFRILLQFRFNQ
jgi:hypothetical protein